MIIRILFVISLLTSLCSANIIAFDYCVGDLSLPYGTLEQRGNTSNPFKSGASTALASQFPGLNGMGISMVRADLDVGGAVPIHTHRVSELLIVIEGTIIAGFIDTNNTVNVGSTPVLAYATFPSENPGVQFVYGALFQSSLSSELVQKITLIDQAQVKKLKKIFGGTNN
uniref:Cupin type-1 domain-containing protein n=1 Tax=Chenopodium quinoa TaxID=63459 RepID=A0A803MYQ1_CHEQI